MSKHKNGIRERAEILVDDTRELLAATAECGEEAVIAARERIADALDEAKDAYIAVRKGAVRGALAADEVIRANPYQGLGIALGAGLILGWLLGRRG